MSRVRDGLTVVDSLLGRFGSLLPDGVHPGRHQLTFTSQLPGTLPSSPSLSKAQKKLFAELRRGKSVLEALLPAAGAQSNEGKEMRDQLALADVRLARLASLEASIDSPSSAGPLSVDPTSPRDPRADALTSLRSASSALMAAVDRAESIVEDLVAGDPSIARKLGDEDARQERVVRLLEWNDAREWFVDRLATGEGMLEGGKVRPEKVLALKEAVRAVVEANEDHPPSIDRTIFRPLGLDVPPAVAPSSPTKVKANAVPPARAASTDGLTGKKNGAVEDAGFQVVGSKKKPTPVQPSSIQTGTPAPLRAASTSSSDALPDNYRTAPCRSFWVNGWCICGSSCTFLHNKSDRKSDFAGRTWSDKKRPCQFFIAGNCRHKHCNLSHDVSLLPPRAFLATALAEAGPPAGPTAPAPAAVAGKAASSPAPAKGGSQANATSAAHRDGERPSTTAPVASPATVTRGNARSLVFKTAICEAWKTGQCAAGARCSYAHGEAEQRTSPEIRAALLRLSNKQSQPTEYGYKERLCTNAERPSGCPFLKNCVFAHGLDELVRSVAERKVTVCKYDSAPRGCARDGCLYLHPSRGPPLDSQSSPPKDKPVTSPPPPPISSSSALSDATQELLTPVGSPQQVEAVVEAPSSSPTSPAAKDDAFGAEALEDTTPTEAPLTNGALAVPPAADSPSSLAAAPPVGLSVAPPVASAAAPRARSTTIAPSRLGPNACLNHMLLGSCANSTACLSRHTVGAEDVAAGVLPLLGPGACLTWFLRGGCANSDACLARHVLTEADFVPLAPSPAHEPSPAPTPPTASTRAPRQPAGAKSTPKPMPSALAARKKASAFFVSDEEEDEAAADEAGW